MRIAFTGPQVLTAQQVHITITALNSLGLDPRRDQIITGGCIGLDALVAHTLYARGFQVHTVLPYNLSKVDPDWQAACQTHERTSQGRTNSETYRIRNSRMVGMADQLVAFLVGGVTGRNGETMTYNLARRAGKTVTVIQL